MRIPAFILKTQPSEAVMGCAHLLLRVIAGVMVFYVHGWHKLEGWIASVQHGSTWKLAGEVAEMRFPAPVSRARMRFSSSSSLSRSKIPAKVLRTLPSKPLVSVYDRS